MSDDLNWFDWMSSSLSTKDLYTFWRLVVCLWTGCNSYPSLSVASAATLKRCIQWIIPGRIRSWFARYWLPTLRRPTFMKQLETPASLIHEFPLAGRIDQVQGSKSLRSFDSPAFDRFLVLGNSLRVAALLLSNYTLQGTGHTTLPLTNINFTYTNTIIHNSSIVGNPYNLV